MNKKAVIKLIRDCAALKRAFVPVASTKELSYACRAMAVALEDLAMRIQENKDVNTSHR